MLKQGLTIIASTLVIGVLATGVQASGGRDHISIVGSSTVYPFTATVAEQFGKTTKFRTPKVESTGSGGGFKLFCAGKGVRTPDITNASRRMKKSEFDMCQANGVKDIIEVQIGYDGIVLANAKEAPLFKLSKKDIFLALAKDVPNPDGSETVVANPHKTWKDVNPSLPDIEIEVLGPPPTSGTRDAFAELALEGGCQYFDWIAKLEDTDRSKYRAICHTVREDGGYVEAGENDNLIIRKLVKNPDALGLFGFGFLDQNTDIIKGSIVEGATPTFENISSGKYPISRSLYIYAKVAHIGVIPGMAEFLAEFTSENTWGPDGYLADKGLIPMRATERAQFAADVKNLTPLDMK